MNADTDRDFNTKFKELDAIFKATLEKYVALGKRDEFNQLSGELGFNDRQIGCLYNCFDTWVNWPRQTSLPPPPPRLPMPPLVSGSSPAPVYAIPKPLAGTKRTRAQVEDDRADAINAENDSDDEEEEQKQGTEPQRKRTKRETPQCGGALDASWSKDEELTVEQQQALEQEHSVYIVEKICAHKRDGCHRFHYNVKWLHYPDKTWEPAAHISPEMLKEYWTDLSGTGPVEQRQLAAKQLMQLETASDASDAGDGDDDEQKNKRTKIKHKNTKQHTKLKIKPETTASARKKKALASASARAPKKLSDSEDKSAIKRRKSSICANEFGEYPCKECGKCFKNRQALGGHVSATKHYQRTPESVGVKQSPRLTSTLAQI